jgi:hypothetical protein
MFTGKYRASIFKQAAAASFQISVHYYKASTYKSEARMHTSFTTITVILYADIFVYKTGSCSKNMLRKKVLQAIFHILLV